MWQKPRACSIVIFAAVSLFLMKTPGLIPRKSAAVFLEQIRGLY